MVFAIFGDPISEALQIELGSIVHERSINTTAPVVYIPIGDGEKDSNGDGDGDVCLTTDAVCPVS